MLGHAGPGNCPRRSLVGKVSESALTAAAAIMALDATAAEVVEELGRHQIPAILLKGPVLTRWLYERRIARAYGDVDLLVSPEDFEAAIRVLRPLGYRELVRRRQFGLSSGRTNSNVCALVHHARRPSRIDLHRGFCWSTMDPHATWRLLREHTEAMTVGGTEMLVLAPPALALVIALHAAQHGPGARPREDLDRAVRRFDQTVWREAASFAARLHVQEAFAAGLRLMPRGRELADRLGLTTSMTVEVALRTGGDMLLAHPIHQLSTEASLRRRLLFLSSKLVPSRDYMRAGYPIARRGTLGLICAYPYRAAMLARQLPHARRALKAARRGAR